MLRPELFTWLPVMCVPCPWAGDCHSRPRPFGAFRHKTRLNPAPTKPESSSPQLPMWILKVWLWCRLDTRPLPKLSESRVK
jgi:hypothetical protein